MLILYMSIGVERIVNGVKINVNRLKDNGRASNVRREVKHEIDRAVLCVWGKLPQFYYDCILLEKNPFFHRF